MKVAWARAISRYHGSVDDVGPTAIVHIISVERQKRNGIPNPILFALGAIPKGWAEISVCWVDVPSRCAHPALSWVRGRLGHSLDCHDRQQLR